MQSLPCKDAVIAYVGLGSNLHDPMNQVRKALTELASLPRTRMLRKSSFYRSPALLSEENPQAQPDYVNAVTAIATELPARTLLDHMLQIEQRHGRRRGLRWAARTLDLDLLLYGDARLDEPGLTVPHPGLPNRAFVLYPLHEIAPDLEVPGCGALTLLKERCQPGAIQRVQESDL